MNDVYLMRHGQSEANADPEAFGQYENENIPLTPKGVEQLLDAGNLIKQDRPDRKSIAIFSSTYLRCRESARITLQTLGMKSHIRHNLLLSEMSYGEQEGCDVEDFRERPSEHIRYKTMGPLHYQPLRGESFLDLHTRAGLFAAQQRFFQYLPFVVIVSHASLCLMMHYFLTGDCPESLNPLRERASLYWPNAMVRKYTSNDVTDAFKYNGILGDKDTDVLMPIS